ncbi:MAG: LysM peptidoglycan-binding domain-containing protein [Anaerolineales bacterium]|nr:LysM peptidoglycan-binding domain-containing protein [Anaerolineales bacterium]
MRRQALSRARPAAIALAGLVLAALACTRADAPVDLEAITPVGQTTPVWLQGAAPGEPTVTLPPPTVPVAGAPSPTARPTHDISLSPTPDATRPSVLERQAEEQYTVVAGDSLNAIGERYGVSGAEIAAANDMNVDDTLFVGQVLTIPIPSQATIGSGLKLLPDSEFVNGPSLTEFNLDAFVAAYGGYLSTYTEEIPGRYLDGSDQARVLSGVDIVRTVAQRYSVSPRLLLAVLEYQSGWVRAPQPSDNTLTFPLGRVEVGREGLYRQLAWAANQLNYGYYAWRAGSLVSWGFGSGDLRLVSPGQNAGTVGVQNFLASLLSAPAWDQAVQADGFYATYTALFDNPFRVAVDPLTPPGLVQPPLQLPIETGTVWSFTGGPHGAWDTGSAWGALDFAPPSDALGCVPSDQWVVAAAPGLIVRTGDGAVLQDLDGDGYEQTGWVLFYMHVEARDRVEPGTYVQAGDRLGHPSCEGGVSDGTHMHFARKYNGEWQAADGPLPFVLDGWVSAGLGQEYDGTLTNGVVTLEACACRAEGNAISRP